MADNVADLVFIPGTRRIRLSMQRPLVRLVIMSSFDILHSLVLFNDAFPDGICSVQFVKEALLRAALKYLPGTAPIYKRIVDDHEYFSIVLPVVSCIFECLSYLRLRLKLSTATC